MYSRKGTSGTSARASYNGRGVLTMSDKLSGKMLANLISKNHIYKRCRGDILKPPVDYAIQAIKDPKTGLFYTDRWTVKQKTKMCDLVNVQHHSSDNRCVKYLKSYAPDFFDISLYSSKAVALSDSRAR